MIRITAAVFVLWISLASAPIEPAAAQDTNAADGPTADIDEAGKSVLVDVWAVRERLQSGRCAVTKRVATEGDEERVAGTMDITFDASRKSIRFEYDSEIEDYLSCLYVETPDSVALYSPETDTMLVRLSGVESWRNRPRPFLDPRNLGLTTDGEVDRRTFDDLQATFTEGVSVRGTLPSPSDLTSRVTLTVRREKLHSIRELVLDPAQGYGVTRMDLRVRSDAAGASDEVVYQARTDWNEVNDTWVPVKCVMQKLSRAPRTTILDLQWSQVNETIDPAQFDWRQLPIPETATVAVRR